MDSSSKKKLIIALCLLDIGLEAYVNQLVQVDYQEGLEELSDSIVGTSARLLEQYQKASVIDKPKVLNQLRETILPKIKAHFSKYQVTLEQKTSEISLVFPEVFELMYGEGLQNAKNIEQNLLFGKPVSDWFDTAATNLAGSVVTSFSEGDGSLSGVVESSLPSILLVTDGIIRHTENNAELALFITNEAKFSKLQFVAVMDSRTSKICKSLNGKKFLINEETIPVPPLHPRCRSRLVPLVGDGIDFPTFNEFLGMLHQQGKIDLIKSILGKGGFDVYSKDKFTSLSFYTTQKFSEAKNIVDLIKEGVA